MSEKYRPLLLGEKKPLRAPHQQHRVQKIRFKNQNLCVRISFRNVIKSVLGAKWVAVARHGLILWENEATGSRKVFKYLPGLCDTILRLNIINKKIKKTTNHKTNQVISVYSDMGSAAWAEPFKLSVFNH